MRTRAGVEGGRGVQQRGIVVAVRLHQRVAVRAGQSFAVEGTREDLDMKALFARPAGPMPFRFGYLDKNNNKHVMITRPK